MFNIERTKIRSDNRLFQFKLTGCQRTQNMTKIVQFMGVTFVHAVDQNGGDFRHF